MIMWSVMAAGGPWSRLHACLPLAIYRISRIALISSLLDKLSVNGDLGVLRLDWSTSSDIEYGRHSILDSSPQTFKGPALAKMAAVGFNPSTNDLAATQPTLMPSAMVPREKTKRPQLSCNPCRQRKVKVGIASSSTATGRSDNHRFQCDRIQPCTACSLHQIAEICQYDLTGTERHPILQAEALKEKDRAIASLRNEIQLLQGQSIKSEPCEEFPYGRNPQKMRLPPRVPVKPANSHPRRFHNGTLNDSIYFGGPAMASVVEEVRICMRRSPTSHTEECIVCKFICQSSRGESHSRGTARHRCIFVSNVKNFSFPYSMVGPRR